MRKHTGSMFRLTNPVGGIFCNNEYFHDARYQRFGSNRAFLTAAEALRCE